MNFHLQPTPESFHITQGFLLHKNNNSIKFDRFSCSSKQAARYHLACTLKKWKKISLNFFFLLSESSILIFHAMPLSPTPWLAINCYIHVSNICIYMYNIISFFLSINVSIYQTHLEKPYFRKRAFHTFFHTFLSVFFSSFYATCFLLKNIAKTSITGGK